MQSGASGIFICLLCQNCVGHRREADGDDRVASDELDLTRFRKQTPESIQDTCLSVLCGTFVHDCMYRLV